MYVYIIAYYTTLCQVRLYVQPLFLYKHCVPKTLYQVYRLGCQRLGSREGS
jgi:hypothetical protein